MSLVGALSTLAALALGVSAGSLVVEGAVLVPYWRSIAPEEFLRWFGQNASRLFRFFGPLEIIAALLAFAAAGVSTFRAVPGSGLLWLAAILALAVLVAFPVYFRAVNESFASGSIALADVPGELQRWSSWHWGRTLLGILSFIAALLALQARAA